MVQPLVSYYLGVTTMVADIADRMANYGETGSMDKGFSIPETKGLVGLDVVPMKSKGLDIALQFLKVVATLD